jgi:eukaryotic-like serine/threonine-protein kinase
MPTERFVSTPTPVGPLTLGARLGKYEIVRRLGAGGMGAVYEARHAEIGKRVAIKVLSPAVAAIPEARVRFLREAQLTSKVRHPHAVDVTDMGTEGDQTFMVMELLDGEDLAARQERAGKMAVAELVDIMIPVCSAVTAAHAAGIVHRDIKPQNIFLARGVHGVVPKVLDFGISKAQGGGAPQPLTGTDAVIGTPYYLAPEQVADNRASSPASDQYAIGVVLYECLSGVRPFQADSLFVVLQSIVAGVYAPLSQHRPDIDPGLVEVVARAMDIDPAARFPSVTMLARALLPFASERGQLLWSESFGGSSTETVDDAGFRAPVSGPRTPSLRTPSPRTQGPRTPGPRQPGQGTPGFRPSSLYSVAPDLRPRSRAPLVAGALALVGLVVGAIWYTGSHQGGEAPAPVVAAATTRPAAPASSEPPPPAAKPAPRSYRAHVVVVPATARIVLDGRDVGPSPFEWTFPTDGSAHTLDVSAEGFETQKVSFQDAPPPPRIALSPRPVAVPARNRPTVRKPAPAPAAPAAPAGAPAERPAPRETPLPSGANGAPVID